MKGSYMPAKEVGNRIRFLREANLYTREEFAEKIGISSKFLYEIEAGKKGFSVEILYRVIKLLGVSSDYLIFGITEDKVSAKTREIIERFDVEQQKHLQTMLEATLRICNYKKSKQMKQSKQSK